MNTHLDPGGVLYYPKYANWEESAKAVNTLIAIRRRNNNGKTAPVKVKCSKW